jgi:uncharacterized membrane protein
MVTSLVVGRRRAETSQEDSDLQDNKGRIESSETTVVASPKMNTIGSNMLKRNWQLIAVITVHGLILLVLFRSGIYHNSTMEHDISLFFNYSSRILNGAIPYQDFTVEYPPLAFIFFTLPHLAASTLGSFHLAFAVEIFIFDVIGLVILHKLSRDLKLNPVITMAVYTALLLAVGPILIYRFDLIPAVITLASIYAFTRKRHKLAWIFLAIAVFTKVYPAVIAPLFLVQQLSHRQYRKAIWGIGTFVITTAIIVIPCLILSTSGFVNSFTMQMQRGLHAETTYSSFLLLGQHWLTRLASG